ncbi:hypothetical protein EMIHUDRAFT_251832 [Emiliania huxleyi CCMP1516]|uniref:Uncharacterized protein n=2 Tax=Emiliania huxleyi TaxID=2903 RepID=A0A0D3KRK7_EMIH1|nr:hypothetical protein EMIHUDRAFT_251832 [Emiliania huxleyi CCMP1516]EOD38392.1 hypothetical protein EMIHUDRAFT_251832 [Emiliania huxleyi CCMP1516]|eukprot:XP_005790821.1 hypothetical protein EMIHUDRAFT_251832 [Emiliania huxleyi CCMP1516]
MFDRARPAHAHGLASTATLCGGIGTVGALWILLALLGFLPTVGGTNPYLAYQRDTYTNVTGRDLQLEAGRTTSLFKTMTETLDLARTNIASGVKEDDPGVLLLFWDQLKPKNGYKYSHSSCSS